MSGRRRQALKPSLFPFLAVLVCTLGTLILLLALVAQNATDAAEQSSQSQQLAQQRAAEMKSEVLPKRPQLDSGTVSSMIEEEQFRVTELVAFRNQQTADVEDRRDQLTHLEDHIARLRVQLKRLSDEVDQATGEAPTNIVDQSAIVQVNKEIADQEVVLAELREAAEGKTPRVIIVPHKGPNGTDRRPIYIECTEHGVAIWPEGAKISTLQLADTGPRSNPLDAALRAIRFHSMQVYGETTPPYPLLVVRPDGIESYAAARQAMQDWDDQFGYELVPATVELAYTQPDAALKQRMEVAIRDAVVQQHARHAIASRSRSYNEQLPTLSAASLDRDGRDGGFKPHREDFRSGGGRSPYTSAPNYTSSSTYSSTSQSGTATHDSRSEAIRRLDDHLRDAAQEMREAGDDGDQAGSPSLLANQFSANRGQAGTDASPPGDTSPQTRINPFGAAEGNANSESGEQSASPANRETSGEFANANSTQAPSEALAQSTESGTHASGDAKRDGGQARAGGGVSPPPADAPPSSSQAGASNPSGGMSPPTDPTTQKPPSISVSSSQNRNVVKRQGRDWALPKHLVGAHGNQIVRTIRVQCYEDRFVLLPPASGGATEMFGYSDGEINRATLQLATAVRDRVDRWGASIPGGRWQPRLDVEVMPHGETRFHQLRTLMSGSGVEVVERASR